jgi:hypothetical protein
MINDRLIILKIRILSTDSVFICGLATAIGHITSNVSRKPYQRSLRPQYAVSPPRRKAPLSGPSLFVCSIKSKTNVERQSTKLLTETRSRCFGFL